MGRHEPATLTPPPQAEPARPFHWKPALIAGATTGGILVAWDVFQVAALAFALGVAIPAEGSLISGIVEALVVLGFLTILTRGALFPLALWLLYRGIRSGRKWAWGAFALVVTLVWLYLEILRLKTVYVDALETGRGVRIVEIAQ